MRAALVAIFLLGMGCTPGPAPVKPREPHPQFPIENDGGHFFSCASCHPLGNATFSKFECLGCHAPKELVDGRHSSYLGYSYDSPTCYRCHGSLGAMSVGGFVIPTPPASDAGIVQTGIDALAHPRISEGASSCTACHASMDGGRGAFAYDHELAPETGCVACHEAGSDLVSAPWVLDAPDASIVPAQCALGGGTIADRGGDTRPVGIAALACSSNAANLMCGSQNCSLNHFYPADCGECHEKPLGVRQTVTTGALFVSKWKFQHYFGPPAQPTTCCGCHAPPSCRP